MLPTNSPAPGFSGILTHNPGLYDRRPANFLASFFVHVIGLAIVLWIAVWMPDRPPKFSPEIRHVIEPISFLSYKPGGHGAKGTHAKTTASQRASPKMTLEDQLTPPQAVPVNLDPRLAEPPRVMALTDVKLPQLA